MRDAIVEQILRERIAYRESGITEVFPHRDTRVEEQPSGWRTGRNVRPAIPPASRYPHSIARANLERTMQPWNRGMLGNHGSRPQL